MKQSIYNRIPDIATDDLITLQTLYAGLCEDLPTPRRHDYRGKCLMRIALVLEERERATVTPPHAKLYET